MRPTKPLRATNRQLKASHVAVMASQDVTLHKPASVLEELFIYYWRVFAPQFDPTGSIPMPDQKFIAQLPTKLFLYGTPFAHRAWKCDFAWCNLGSQQRMVVVEIEGGLHIKGGNHTTPEGYQDNCEKYNSIQMAGGIVLRYGAQWLKDGAVRRTSKGIILYERTPERMIEQVITTILKLKAS